MNAASPIWYRPSHDPEQRKLLARHEANLRWFFHDAHATVGLRSSYSGMISPVVLGAIIQGGAADDDPMAEVLSRGGGRRLRAVWTRLLPLSQVHRDALWVMYGSGSKTPLVALGPLTDAGRALLGEGRPAGTPPAPPEEPRSIALELSAERARIADLEKTRDTLLASLERATGCVEIEHALLEEVEGELREARATLRALRATLLASADAPRHKPLAVLKHEGPLSVVEQLWAIIAARHDAELTERRVQAQARRLAEDALLAYAGAR